MISLLTIAQELDGIPEVSALFSLMLSFPINNVC